MSATRTEDVELLRAAFEREPVALERSEAFSEAVTGGVFVACAVLLALLAGLDGDGSLLLAVGYVLTLALAARVRFDYGAGFTVPTQLVFVPMLLALPAGALAPLTALALALALLPDVVRGAVSPSRLWLSLGNSAFALGPAAVLALAGGHVSRVPLVALAVAAQLAVDFAFSMLRERLRGGLDVRELATEVRDVYGIDVALSAIGFAFALGADESDAAFLLAVPLLGLLGVFSRERRERLDQLIELNDAYRGTALVLGDVVEADDAYTGEHTQGVVSLSLAVSDRMGLGPERRRLVEFGALLHDLGKVAVPKEIINKPGKLDEAEWAIIRQHTIEGQRLLDRVGGRMADVGRVVRSSHERWDGAGYPDGLAGADIPLEARIVTACDAFNAMVTDRSYRRAMDRDDAIAEMRRCAGSQFDPDVVEALIAVVDT